MAGIKAAHRMSLDELINTTRTFSEELGNRLQAGIADLDARRARMQDAADQLAGRSGALISNASALLTGRGAVRLALPAPTRSARSPNSNEARSMALGANVHVQTTAMGRKNARKASAAFLRGVPGASHGGVKITVNPPRYRNPNNPDQTWTGMGKTPAWLKQLVKRGAEKDSFIIAGTEKPHRRSGSLTRLARVQDQNHSAPVRRGPGRPRNNPNAQPPIISNPHKPSERWNGHGVRPGWYGAAIREGYTLEQMNIGGPVTPEFKKRVKEAPRSYVGAAGLHAAMNQVAASLGEGASHGVGRGHTPPSPDSWHAGRARFRNPADENETWSGGGTAPAWMREQINAGHKPQEFLIPGAPMPNRKDFAEFMPALEQVPQGESAAHA